MLVQPVSVVPLIPVNVTVSRRVVSPIVSWP
jgi:hypothetical protein